MSVKRAHNGTKEGFVSVGDGNLDPPMSSQIRKSTALPKWMVSLQKNMCLVGGYPLFVENSGFFDHAMPGSKIPGVKVPEGSAHRRSCRGHSFMQKP